MPVLSPKLRFGAFIAPFHPIDENPTLAIERDLELVQWMDTLGYDEAWIGEHHSAGFEIIAPENPNPVELRLKLRTALSRYQFSTRIRLAMSQEIWVVSLLDDGSQLGSSLHTVVTDTACFDET